MQTLTFKEKRILGMLAKHPAAWQNVAREFSMGEADFKVAAEKAMAKSYRIGKEQTKLAIDAAENFLPKQKNL